MSMKHKKKPAKIKEYSPIDLFCKTSCPTCGYGLEWRAIYDADGNYYEAKCCGKLFCAVTSKLAIIGIDDLED